MLSLYVDCKNFFIFFSFCRLIYMFRQSPNCRIPFVADLRHFADCWRSAKPLPQYGFEFYVYFRRFSHRMRILLSYFPVYCKKGRQSRIEPLKPIRVCFCSGYRFFRKATTVLRLGGKCASPFLSVERRRGEVKPRVGRQDALGGAVRGVLCDGR